MGHSWLVHSFTRAGVKQFEQNELNLMASANV